MQELHEGIRLADRYALKNRLAEGGMAEVWLARDERADTTVALKFLNRSLAEKAGQRELFRKEWQTASRLMHAHIVRVFEYHDEERPYYALQYVDGPHIGDLAGEPIATMLPAIGLVADALRYAHAKGVVHRDIKAANVLLDQRGAPCVIDFGIAAANDGGSAANASPGQRAGKRPEPADDVYALGVLLHELISGEPPPPDRVDALRSRSGEALPTAVRQLVADMLANSADDRPTAEQVRQRLDDAGFAAAPARLPPRLKRSGASVVDDDVAVQTVQPRRTTERPSAGTSGTAPGLSPSLVYGGLAVLLALLVGVTVILPDAVEERPPSAAADFESPSAAGDDAGPAADDAGRVDDALVDVVPGSGLDGDDAGFSENLGQTSSSDGMRAKLAADEALGDLLSQLERLRYRGIERWGGQPYLDAVDVYQQGDEAYLNKNYASAAERYARAGEMLEPFFDRIEDEFRRAMDAARAAFERQDADEAVRLFDLAVAITPGSAEAEQGLERARNLEGVLDLMRQGRQFLDELQLEAARLAFEKALELDPLWEPARDAIESVRAQITQRNFEARMSEGFTALAEGDFDSARVAFNAAKSIYPDSPEPRDGLLQVDQEVRLYRISSMEDEASAQEAGEQWEAAVNTYEALLEVDGDLAFAQEGLARAQQRAGLHRQLQAYIDDPDSLSDPANMQQATQLMLTVSRMDDVGPRLDDHKETLARLLKRAATPLTVELLSDNATQVSVYRVGKLGSFDRRELELRPGNYVAVGVRPGYRDVRREFRVAPEIDMQPVVVQCEEPI